jgi:hypothetical protein
VNLDINILFNLVLGALSFLGGWLFTRVFSLFDKQEKLMKDLNDKTFSDFIILRKELEAESRRNEQDIADLALKVSTTYATKDTVENAMEKIEDKLDRNFELIQQYFFDKN